MLRLRQWNHWVFAFFAVFCLLGTASLAYGQQLKVATGDPKGTYSRMFKEMGQLCGNQMVLVEQNTKGAVENLDLITGNSVNGAFAQVDILHLAKQQRDMSQIKTLLTMHPEEVHFVASAVPFKVGGTFGFGGKEVTYNYVTDLQDRIVGAAGGSIMTAKVIRLNAEIRYNIAEFPNNDALLAALRKGEIQAAVFVGGAPLSSLEALGKEFKILSFNDQTINKLKDIYRPAKVSYMKMTDSAGISTVATEAVLVTRDYKTEKMVSGLAKLRQCVMANIDELKETTGMHPKWQSVDIHNKGKWVWYDLPEASVKPVSNRK